MWKMVLREMIVSLCSALVRETRELCPVLAFPVQEKQGQNWSGTSEEPQRDQGTGASLR